MVDGLTPHIAYYPVAAIAALTAALVTLIVAVNAWRRSTRSGGSSSNNSSSSSCKSQSTSDHDFAKKNTDENSEGQQNTLRNRKGNSKFILKTCANELSKTEKKVTEDFASFVSSEFGRKDSSDSSDSCRGVPELDVECTDLAKDQNEEDSSCFGDTSCDRTDKNSSCVGNIPLFSVELTSENNLTSNDDSFLITHGIIGDSHIPIKSAILEAFSQSLLSSNPPDILNNVDLSALHLNGNISPKETANNVEYEICDGLLSICDKKNRSRQDSEKSYDSCFQSLNDEVSPVKNYEKVDDISIDTYNMSDDIKIETNHPVLLPINFEKFSVDNSSDLMQVNNERSSNDKNNKIDTKNNYLNFEEEEEVLGFIFKATSEQTSTENDSNLGGSDTSKLGDNTSFDTSNNEDPNMMEGSIVREIQQTNAPFENAGSNQDELSKNKEEMCLKISRSLDSVFFYYDCARDLEKRSKLVLKDDSLLTKIDTSAIEKSMPHIDKTFDEATNSTLSEGGRRFRKSRSAEYDIPLKQLIPVTFKPVSFNDCDTNISAMNTSRVIPEENHQKINESNEIAPEIREKWDCETEIEIKHADAISVAHEGSSSVCLDGENLSEKSACGGKDEDARPGSFGVRVTKEGVQEQVGVNGERRVSKGDNEEEDRGEDSCSLSSDVTSSAMYDGKSDVVQGSCREELIGKACSHIVAETRSKDVCGSPAYDSRNMQMADANADIWPRHDSDTIRAASGLNADRLGRLDELVDHLRELAGTESPDSGNLLTPGLVSYAERSQSAEKASCVSEAPVCPPRRALRSGKTRIIFSEHSTSESSNYASDDSQSIHLSSINGETSSLSSWLDSGTESPVPTTSIDACEKDINRLIVEKEFSKGRQSENSTLIKADLISVVSPNENNHSFQGFSTPGEGNDSNFSTTITCDDSISPRKYGSSSESKQKEILPTLDSTEIYPENIVRSIDELYNDYLEETMESSSREIRLQKLLERDKQRLERQKSKFQTDNTVLSNKNQPSVESEEQGDAVQAMKTAIGHMQRLIQKERSPTKCHNYEQQSLSKQYLTIRERQTIDIGNNTEVRRFELLAFDSMSGKPSDEKVGETTGQKNTSEKREECENICSSENKSMKLREKTNNEKCRSPTKNIETNVNNEILVTSDADRWSCESTYSEKRADAPQSTFSVSDRVDFLPAKEHAGDKIVKSSFNPFTTLKKLNEIYRDEVDFQKYAEEERSKFGERCRYDRSAASEITDDVGESPPLCLRDRAAATLSTPFSDDLREEQVPEMENGEMENASSPPPPPSTPTANAATNTTTPTPTKIKNLRFKLDPDIFDLPSENGYYLDDDEEYNRRPAWKKQSKYQTFSALELGRNREPVKVVSVRTSVVPAGTKMVVKPVCVSEGQPSAGGQETDHRNSMTVKHLDIDLHIRLETQEREAPHPIIKRTEPVVDVRGDWRTSPEKQHKRSYVSSSPYETKKRSHPISIADLSGWNQSLSPVSENCDWVAVPSTSDEAILSTSSDPGEQQKVFTLDNYVNFNSYDDLKLSQNSNENSKFINSSLNGNDTFGLELSNQSNVIGSPEKLNNSFGAPVTSTPARPSTLELNHYRKHLQIPRKKFVPDPDAVERITGFKAAEDTTSTKPPLPPSIRALPHSHRMNSGAKNRIDQLRKKYLDSKSMIAAQKLDSSGKFEDFLSRAQEERAKIATSTPDLAAFEAAVRNQWSKTRNDSCNNSLSKENTPPLEISDSGVSVRSATPDDVWMNYVQLLRRQLNRRSQSMTYLETDVDAFFGEDKCQSMVALDSPPNSTQSLITPTVKSKRISMNLEESGRTKSEHELRIEKSLQNLTVPEWYKHSQRPKAGFILDKKNNEKKGWAAAKSLTSSTSSLSSASSRPRRPARSLRTSQENLMWSRSSASPASADNSYGRYTKSSNAPVLSLALAKAFREPYIGWRARTPSSCTSASPHVDLSPPSWVIMDNTDRSDTPLTSDLQAMDEDEDTGMSFDGEDVIEDGGSSDAPRNVKLPPDSSLPSADDTCDDIINISMDTCDHPSGHQDDSKSADLPGEDTCDDIKNITMDTFELYPPIANDEQKASPIGDNTCDDVLNISTDNSSQLNPVHGNQGTSSVMGVTENTGIGIDDISTDTPAVSKDIANGNHDKSLRSTGDHRISNNSYRDSGNLNGSERSLGNYKVNDTVPEEPSRLTNGDRNNSNSDINIANGNGEVFHRSRNGNHHVNGNGNVISVGSIDKYEIAQNRLDPKRKRYSYNRSIYQSELDGVKSKVVTASKRTELDGSTQSLPGEKKSRDANKVIWIESSFVGSRTTTSIVVLPTEPSIKDKGSTENNSLVGRPASR